MNEIVSLVPEWEIDVRNRIDARVEQTVQSGLALPEDVEKLRVLANLTKLAINWRIEGAALNFGRQLIELSDEITGSAMNIEQKIQGLNI